MIKILYVTECNFKNRINNGGEIVSFNNFELLNIVSGSNVEAYNLYYSPNLFSKFFKLVSSFFGYYYPMTLIEMLVILRYVRRNGFTHVYLDNSRLGGLAKFLANYSPEIKVITFFHNDEVKYRKSMNHNHLFEPALIRAIGKVQNNALTYSHYTIFLSSDEGVRLSTNTKWATLPVTIKESSITFNCLSKKPVDDDYILFFGSCFHANLESVRWIKDNIMPFVEFKLLVVGRGFEEYEEELARDNITVVGGVDDITSYIKCAKIVLCPIFSGAGVKVKLVESLMYGKLIITNDFALQGLEGIDEYVISCSSSEEFINEIIANFDRAPLYSDKVREYYDQNLSKSKAIDVMREVFRV